MNRAERRRQQRKALKKTKAYVMKQEQIEAIKDTTTEKAVDTAFKLMLCIPVMAIHDYYPKLMRREVDGKSREETMADIILEIYDSYNKGYITLDDLEKCLYEETGMKFDKE